ncbi:MAG: ATP-binding protein [Treponema sp.]|nr:ATP-binding protein [Treponema sp.]MBR6155223.1 ATP-binding protein [Treponema sp.]
MSYRKRLADTLLDEKLESFGATLITGPKGCGKTTTAKQKAASIIEFQDEDRREEYLSVANTQPSKLLVGATPRLFDEWQDAPKIWGAIRKSVDDRLETGLYILTGSTSQTVTTPHTGTLRISTMKMYPMSLYESGESNGTVSLGMLFEHPEQFDGCKSDLDIDGIIYALCRGGWPSTLKIKSEKAKLNVARDLYAQTVNVDISNVDNIRRNPVWAENILKSYSRNICTLADIKTIYKDVSASTEISESTFFDYVSALEKLFIIEDIDAWCPAIRSKTAIRASKKRNLIDPSIAVAAMHLTPDYFNTDFKTLGFLFESLCFRDLKVYSSARDGRMSYYHDRYGLEADAVLHLGNGQYAIMEIKLGSHEIDEGAKHLLQIESLVKKYNEEETQVPLRLPDLKIVLTATEYGYRREDGVFVIPLACLRE